MKTEWVLLFLVSMIDFIRQFWHCNLIIKFVTISLIQDS